MAREGTRHTICQYRFNLEFVPLPELDDRTSCEGGKHSGGVPASTEMPKLEQSIIDVVVPSEHAIACNFVVEWSLAHVGSCPGGPTELLSGLGVPRHDDVLARQHQHKAKSNLQVTDYVRAPRTPLLFHAKGATSPYNSYQLN